MDADELIAALPQCFQYPLSAQEKLESHYSVKADKQPFDTSEEIGKMSRFIRTTLDRIGRNTSAFCGIPLLLLPVMLICSLPAHADYSFQLVNPPGADFTQTFGINNAGKVTGATNVFSFIYDMKSGEYTVISYEMGVLDISNPGVVVGSVDGVCAIRDKDGTITTFSPPFYTTDSLCRARGVNPDGKVSGFVQDVSGVTLGYIYDSEYGTYEEFLPSPLTIAHAINAQGQNVGSVYLFEHEAYAGSPEGTYGYLRQTDGSVKYFAISQSAPGQTRARGISENGLISGFYRDPDTFEIKSYVTALPKGTGYEDISLTDDQVLYQKPCEPDLPPPPGPEYELFTDMYAEQIRNDGVVVGICADTYFNDETGDFIEYTQGFIATPIK